MAYDFARGQVVMFGGSGVQSVGSLNDTWVWDGSNWIQKFPQKSPPVASYEMAYDSGRDQGYFVRWRPNLGVGWIQLDARISPSSTPPQRFGHAMAYDPNHDQVVLFGGQDGDRTFHPLLRHLDLAEILSVL